MNSKQLLVTATIFALSAFGPHSSAVWAQLDMAQCDSGWEWNTNSFGQDPCAISSALDAACRGSAIYSIPPLNSTEHYVPPQRDGSTNMDLVCDCDTVMYSLYMACTTCQGAEIYSWTKWMTQCDNVYVAQYPHDVPPGTAIPRWALYDVTTLPNETYSDAMAISIGRNPEQPPKTVSTVSLGSSTLSGSHTSPGSTSPTGATGGKSSRRGKNTGAIAGGVVGGVVGLIALVLGGLYARRRGQAKGGVDQQQPPKPLFPEVSEYKGQPPASPMSATGMNPPFSPYNPEDPSTYPPPVGDGHSSLLTYVNPANGQQGRGRYAGVPEV